MKIMRWCQCETTRHFILSMTLIAGVDPSFVPVDMPRLLNELLPMIAVYTTIFGMLASVFLSSVVVRSNALSQATML